MTDHPGGPASAGVGPVGILLRIGSALALVWTIVPSVLFAAGTIDLDAAKVHMLLGTAAWFVLTPIWMWRPARRRGEAGG